MPQPTPAAVAAAASRAHLIEKKFAQATAFLLASERPGRPHWWSEVLRTGGPGPSVPCPAKCGAWGSHQDEIDRSGLDQLFHSLPQGVVGEVVAWPDAGVYVRALPTYLVKHRTEPVRAFCGP